MHWINQAKFKLLVTSIRLGLFFGKEISLVDYGLLNADVRELFAALDAAPRTKARIERLDFSNTVHDAPTANKLNAVVIKGFKNLKSAKLAKNRLSSFLIIDSPSIESLSVAINSLENIPGLEKLTKLSKLDVYGNNVRALDLRRNRALREVDAQRNFIRQANLCNLPKLEIAYLANNPLETLEFAGSPLSIALTVSDNNLDDLSKLNLAAHKRALTNTAAVQNVGYYRNILTWNTNTNLSTQSLVAYFHRVFSQNASTLNKMLGAARVAYFDMLKKAPNLPELPEVFVREIVMNTFSANVRAAVVAAFQALAKEGETVEDRAHNTLLANFINTEFKTLLQEKLNQAKGLFFNQALTDGLQKYRQVQMPAVTTAKAELEAISHNPGFFLTTFNRARSSFNSFLYPAHRAPAVQNSNRVTII